MMYHAVIDPWSVEMLVTMGLPARDMAGFCMEKIFLELSKPSPEVFRESPIALLRPTFWVSFLRLNLPRRDPKKFS